MWNISLCEFFSSEDFISCCNVIDTWQSTMSCDAEGMRSHIQWDKLDLWFVLPFFATRWQWLHIRIHTRACQTFTGDTVLWDSIQWRYIITHAGMSDNLLIFLQRWHFLKLSLILHKLWIRLDKWCSDRGDLIIVLLFVHAAVMMISDSGLWLDRLLFVRYYHIP